MRATRLKSSAVFGLALLAVGTALPFTGARAVLGSAIPDYSTSAFHYTDKPSPAIAAARDFDLYIVDGDFDPAERERVGLAIEQWNHVLNGFVRFRVLALPPNPSTDTLQQIQRSGSWVVIKVDNHSAVPHETNTLGVTGRIKGHKGGFVYVMADRLATRDLTALMLHELGHVLGAGHDPKGHLMLPGYNRTNAHCIDYNAVVMVAAAQRLPLNQLNWCIGPGI